MTIPGQIHYDYLEPADDPDDQALLHVENALEMLEKAAKALRADPPRWSEARGLTEDAAAELSNIN